LHSVCNPAIGQKIKRSSNPGQSLPPALLVSGQPLTEEISAKRFHEAWIKLITWAQRNQRQQIDTEQPE
jgi:hypothetical protein